jgi:hypothetical protein
MFDKIYNSITEAANTLGVKVPNICRVLSGERKRIHGYEFTDMNSYMWRIKLND